MNHQPTRQVRRSARRRVEPERFEPEGRERNDHRPVPYARHRRRRQERREQVLNTEIARVTESRHVSSYFFLIFFIQLLFYNSNNIFLGWTIKTPEKNPPNSSCCNNAGKQINYHANLAAYDFWYCRILPSDSAEIRSRPSIYQPAGRTLWTGRWYQVIFSHFKKLIFVFRYKPLARNILWHKPSNDENENLLFVTRYFSLALLRQNDNDILLSIARACNNDLDQDVPVSTIVYEFEKILPASLAQVVTSSFYCSACQRIIGDEDEVRIFLKN